MKRPQRQNPKRLQPQRVIVAIVESSRKAWLVTETEGPEGRLTVVLSRCNRSPSGELTPNGHCAVLKRSTLAAIAAAVEAAGGEA